MNRRVVVTGMGVLAPNGIGKKEFADAIFSGRSGISAIQSIDSTNSGVKIAGEVKNFDPFDYMPVSVVRKADRFVHLGLAATKLAMEDAQIQPDEANEINLKDAYVIIGSGQGGLTFHEQTILKFIESDPTVIKAADFIISLLKETRKAFEHFLFIFDNSDAATIICVDLIFIFATYLRINNLLTQHTVNHAFHHIKIKRLRYNVVLTNSVRL